ncbi:MAG: hypothetical protein R2932_60120 [Caldilineaceae bacterium]
MSTTAVTSTPAITGLVDRQAGSTRLQPYLETMALVDPTDTVRVIVQYQGDSEGLSQQVRLAQGEIVNELALINALVIKVPVGALPSLAKQDSVRWIALRCACT